jgi:hypothetical protein
MGTKFRFQVLKIWQLAVEIMNNIPDPADELRKKILFRLDHQIKSALMSMSSHIA